MIIFIKILMMLGKDRSTSHLHYEDLTDSTNLIRIIQQVQPDEIYNSGSKYVTSFEAPEYTANSDALRTLRILEAVRILGLSQKLVYQAIHQNFIACETPKVSTPLST